MLIGLALLVAALAASAGDARAADECKGLSDCISVPGPWVVVAAPEAGSRAPSSSWLLKCPEGLVGGLDARLTRRELDVSFRGLLGSPVNPGITTTNAAIFTGTYTGRLLIPTAFRPFIGCIPTSGARTPTSFRPGNPTVARVRTVPVVEGRLTRISHGCGPGERLVSSTRAVGIYGEAPPSAADLALVKTAGTVRNGRILASASRHGLAGRRVELQVVAICTRGAEP